MKIKMQHFLGALLLIEVLGNNSPTFLCFNLARDKFKTLSHYFCVAYVADSNSKQWQQT